MRFFRIDQCEAAVGWLSFCQSHVHAFSSSWTVLSTVYILEAVSSQHLLSALPNQLQGRHRRDARAKARKDPYNGSVPLPLPLPLPTPFIFQNKGKTWVLPVLPHMEPLSLRAVLAEQYAQYTRFLFQTSQAPTKSPNVSTTPLRQWGFQQCLPFSWATLRYKHCFTSFCLLLQEVTWQCMSFLPAGWLKGLCIFDTVTQCLVEPTVPVLLTAKHLETSQKPHFW